MKSFCLLPTSVSCAVSCDKKRNCSGVFNTYRDLQRKKVPGLNRREEKHRNNTCLKRGSNWTFLRACVWVCTDTLSPQPPRGTCWRGATRKATSWVLGVHLYYSSAPIQGSIQASSSATAACSAVCTNSPGSARCSQHSALSFPLNTSATFLYQWVLFWSVYFFGNRHAPLKHRIIICPHEFSPARVNLSSTGERLRRMALNVRGKHYSNSQQWKSWNSLKWMEWVCIYPWARRDGAWVFTLLENWMSVKKLITNTHCSSTTAVSPDVFRYSCLLCPHCLFLWTVPTSWRNSCCWGKNLIAF